MLLKKGVFASFPNEWTMYVPFNNWIIPALFLIILFGIGNAFASLNGLLKKERKLYNLTMIMGILLMVIYSNTSNRVKRMVPSNGWIFVYRFNPNIIRSVWDKCI